MITDRMMNVNIVKKYLKECKGYFPVYGKKERLFLCNLKQQVEETTERMPNLDYKELKEKIGTPMEVLQSYYEEVEDREKLIKRICFIKELKKIFIVLSIVLTVFFTCKTWKLYNDYQEFKQSNTLYEEEIIKRY